VNITERVMRAGSWSLELLDTTPEHVLAELRKALGWAGGATWTPPDGHIVVTKAPVDVSAMSLALSTYTGRLTMQDGAHSFSGLGLGSWIGCEGAPCDTITPDLTDGTFPTFTYNISQWVTQIFPSNGITVGTVSGSGTLYQAQWSWTSPVEMLDAACRYLGMEWRINPTGTIDVNTAANLFAVGSAFISDRGGEAGVSPVGVFGTATSPKIDASGVTSDAIVAGEGEGAAISEMRATGTNFAYGIGGSAATTRRQVDAPQADDVDAGAAADAVIAAFNDPRFSFDIAVTSPRPREALLVGDVVYAYFPEAGIQNQAQLVTFRGEDTFPVSVNVQRMTTNIVEGHGIYLYRNSGTGVFTDLTPHINWPSAGAQLEVGSFKGWGDLTVLGGQARF
jgi:hypothetical protein